MSCAKNGIIVHEAGRCAQLQIAAALHSGCQAFLTNDQELSRLSELRIIVLKELEL
jgi:hypothetical protein